MLETFAKTDKSDEDMGEILRSKYKTRADGTVELSPELLQQVENEIPVAGVWLQSLIDSGKIDEITGFEGVKTAREAIARVDGENAKNFYKAIKESNLPNDKIVDEGDEKAGSVEVPIDDTYMVVVSQDLEKWLKVLARAEKSPKGIIVVDHNKVRLENFASSHEGDQKVLTEELRKIIPEGDGYIDYDGDVLGEKVTDERMAGHKRHVIGEKYLGNRKSLRKGKEGAIRIA